MPKVSVIIPTYNRAEFVTRAIDSVLAQTYKDYEIIVVDSSTDNTRKVLEAYRGVIRYFYQERAGISAARNLGIRQTEGEWVTLLDSDDEWLPERLEVAMFEVTRTPRLVAHFVNLMIHCPNIQAVNLFDIRNLLHKNRESWVIENPLVEQLKHQFCFSSNYFGRRDALFSAGLFDEKLTIHEDLDLFFRLALVGPWGVNARTLVRLIRRNEPAGINLSQQRIDRPVYSCECKVSVYDKLFSNPKLGPEEKAIVAKYLSGARFDLGIANLKAGHRPEGVSNIKQSFRDNPSPKSLIKYALVRLLGPAGMSLIEKKRSLGKKEFRRSDYCEGN